MKDDILYRELSPGERMPTVEELHKLHGVSQGTIHKTLDLLERDGLISKKKGTGISVREDIRILNDVPVMTGEAYKSGILQFDMQILSMNWVEASARIRNRFNNRADAFQNDKIFQVRSLLTHKDDPQRKNYNLVLIPAWIINQVGKDIIRCSGLEGLVQFNGIKTDRIAVESRAWNCNAEIEEILGLTEGNAVFRRMYTHYSVDNRILTFVDSVTSANITHSEIKLEW